MPSGFLDCVAITSVEAMPGIAGVIHHDMNCHYLSPLSPFVGAQTDEARFRRDDAKAAPKLSDIPGSPRALVIFTGANASGLHVIQTRYQKLECQERS
jgi:hypothetical protein